MGEEQRKSLKSHVLRKDVKNGRERWRNELIFIACSLGASIGFGNIWKFPAMTAKYGGVSFLVAYLVIVVIMGAPMLVLEQGLGQKMQRGSAGSLRGITPRLAGVGWVASYTGFIIATIYSVILGLNLIYLFKAGGQPWTTKNFKRPETCNTDDTKDQTSAELYFYFHSANSFNAKTCDPFEQDEDPIVFNGLQFGLSVVSWVLCFCFLIKGTKSITVGNLLFVPFTFIAVFILMGYYVNLNNSNNGLGINFFMGTKKFPYTEAIKSIDQLIVDAYTQVFFSMGLCMGVHYSYSSYNHIKRPII